MKSNGAKQVKIFDITLRDGSQSKVATRIKLDDLLKVAGKLADTGIYGAETWGGATFDVCVRFLREDPWDRSRRLKEAMPGVKTMMLIRGQNLVAYYQFSRRCSEQVRSCLCSKRHRCLQDLRRIRR